MTNTNATAAPAAKGATTVTTCLELLTKGRDQRLRGIAKRLGFIETLETRNSDRLDFHQVSVDSLKLMLLAAYNTGVADAEKRRVPRNQDAKHLLAGIELARAEEGK